MKITCADAAAQIRNAAGLFAYGPAVGDLLAGLDEAGEMEVPADYVIDIAAHCQIQDTILALLN